MKTAARISLGALFFGSYRHQVLSLLLARPGESFHLREIARLTRTQPGTLRRELTQLADAGVLERRKVGNQVRYQADTDCPIYDELAGIVHKTAVGAPAPQSAPRSRTQAVHEPRAEYVAGREPLKPAAPRDKLAALCRRHRIKRLGIFGSAARGEAGRASDLDLLAEFEEGAPVSLFDMVRARDELSRLFGRKVDLATPAVFENPYRRQAILRDLREVYAA